ncbi:MAG: hypothetical protein IPM24_22590 [Bryobacterales bacterium]|nr:hypothetical protein [Bryobacterales bacterium]
MGYGHEIRLLADPVRGAGEQYVRQRYAVEVAAIRARSKKAATALVVLIDADTGTVDERARQLAQALASEGLRPRDQDENIAHFIPKRAIETWTLCLHRHAVDEETSYRKDSRVDDQAIKGAALRFFEWTRPNFTLPDDAIPSLLAAIPEALRIPAR